MNDAFDRVRALNVEGYVATSGAAAGAAAGTAGTAGASSSSSSRDLRVDMNDQMVIVVGALCKMFVGDLVHGGERLGFVLLFAIHSREVDGHMLVVPFCSKITQHATQRSILPPTPYPINTTARQVMDERGEEGAIKPHHLREAHRRAVKEKRLPVMRPLP